MKKFLISVSNNAKTSDYEIIAKTKKEAIEMGRHYGVVVAAYEL